MKKIIYSLFLISWLTAGMAVAQVPVPSDAQSGPILLKGATIHIGNGQVIENGIISFDNGKITQVGSGGNESGHTVIDVSGKHIYPGFILVNSQLGLEEVSSVRAMSDSREQGEFNPNVRAQIAFNTDSENIPVFRFNGILLAEATPSGGTISGSSSIMQLDAWNWEDATVKADAAVHMNWPGRMRRNFDFNTFTVTFGPNQNYDNDVAGIRDFFNDAISYGKIETRDMNLKLEAMQGLFKGSKTLVIHADGAKEIVESVKFARSMGVDNIGVVSGDAAVYTAEFLADNNIPVVIPSIHRTPGRNDDDYDMAYKLAVELSERNVKVILSHTGMMGLSRNLPFYAGTSVAMGMDKEEALRMITQNPAEMLGISDQYGTLETGKNATLFVSEGDALDYSGNILSHAFISGRQIQLDGKQQWLNKKYSDKYGH